VLLVLGRYTPMIPKKPQSVQKTARFLRHTLVMVLFVLVVMGLFGKRGLYDLRRMRNENQRLSQEIHETRQQNEALKNQIIALQKDPQEQEHIIRRFLGYIKPHETVIEF